jgi:phthalate 3,4-dioxygenase alpha subunit
VLPFISIRMWQPVSENETEVYSWFAVDAAAPEEFKKNSYKAYLMCFGSTGMFEQDDVENWVSLTNTAGGSMARRLLLNSRMGLREDDRALVEPLPPEFFHGPGRAQVGYNENNQRQLLRLWADHLELPPIAPATTSIGKTNPNGLTPPGQTDASPAPKSNTADKAALR